MIKKLYRTCLRLLVTACCSIMSGVFGWCLMGWMNGAPNAPQALYQQALRGPQPKPDAQHSAQEAAFRSVQEAFRTGSVESALRKLLAHGRASPGSLAALLKQNGRDKDPLLQALLHSLRPQTSSNDHYAGSLYVANVLRTWFAGDHQACLTAVENLPPYLQGKLPTRLLKAATMLNGQAALTMLGPQLMDLIPPDGMDITLHAWAEQDSAGALAFAQQLESEKHRALALQGVLTALATTDPTRSLQLLTSVAEADRPNLAKRIGLIMTPQAVLANYSQLQTDGASASIWPALGNLAQTDPASVQRWIHLHPEVWSQSKVQDSQFQNYAPVLQSTCLPVMALAAQALASGSGDPKHIIENIENTASVWVGPYGNESAKNWIASEPDPAVLAPALRGLLRNDLLNRLEAPATIIGYWEQTQRLDPVGAAREENFWWMKNLMRGLPPADQTQYRPILDTLTPPQQAGLFQDIPALPLTLHIQDFTARQKFESKIISTYGQTHPDQIEAWIQQLPTAEERTAAQNELSKGAELNR